MIFLEGNGFGVICQGKLECSSQQSAISSQIQRWVSLRSIQPTTDLAVSQKVGVTTPPTGLYAQLCTAAVFFCVIIFKNRMRLFGGILGMSKLTGPRGLKLINVRKTALYNARGCRHGSVRYRSLPSSKSQRHQSFATLLWYAMNGFQKRK